MEKSTHDRIAEFLPSDQHPIYFERATRSPDAAAIAPTPASRALQERSAVAREVRCDGNSIRRIRPWARLVCSTLLPDEIRSWTSSTSAKPW